jgi:accessory gene regulator protein AgrB
MPNQMHLTYLNYDWFFSSESSHLGEGKMRLKCTVLKVLIFFLFVYVFFFFFLIFFLLLHLFIYLFTYLFIYLITKYE